EPVKLARRPFHLMKIETKPNPHRVSSALPSSTPSPSTPTSGKPSSAHPNTCNRNRAGHAAGSSARENTGASVEESVKPARNVRNHNRRISRRVHSVAPSGIRRYFDIAATMEDVISLGIGEPDFVTP